VSVLKASPSPACALEIKSAVTEVTSPSSLTGLFPCIDAGPEANWALSGRPGSRLLGVYIRAGSNQQPATSDQQPATEGEQKMGKIVMSGPQNVTLDGVVQDPDGEEGFTQGGWFRQFGGKDLQDWAEVALADALGAEAWLLGRRSYEYFGVRWRARSGELADRLNSIPKYVVSSTLVDPDWTNSRIVRGDVVTEVSKLKQELDGEIVVPGSYQLGRALMEHDLVDELRLVVFPVVLGAGQRLFGEAGDKKPLHLVSTKTIGDSLAFLTYQLARED
jgi:dihydrofolate reductase